MIGKSENRGKTLSFFLVVGCLACLISKGWAQNTPFFKIYPVSGNVYMLEAPGAGGNIGVLVGDDGVLLVDDRFDQDVDALMTALAEVSDQQVSFVINTHVHPDHIGGNARLAAEGALLLAHDTVREQMMSELRIPRREGIFFPQPPESARPVITYSEGITFHTNDEEVRVWLAPPAHTGGDSFVHFVGSDVLHLGDVFRTNMYPIIDHYNGGSFLGMIEAMGMAIGIAGPDTKIIPGHGEGFTDRDGLIEVHTLLLEMRDRVQSLIDQGLSLEQAVSAGPFDTYEARWGQVPTWTSSDVITIIYQELSRSSSPDRR